MALTAVCLAIYVRFRLAGMPLDRDEGEFAYAGQLALRGVPPYLMAYNMKLPGIYWLYALIMGLFGQTDVAIRTGFLIINLFNAALIFSIGKKLMDSKAGFAAAACFIIIMMSNWLQGMFACAENGLLLFALAGLRVIMAAVEKGSKRLYVLAGLLLGMSLVVRQHGLFFLAAGVVYAAYDGRAGGLKRAAINCLCVIGGALAPVAVMTAYIYAAGVSSNFFFWVFTYGMKYVSSVSPASGAALFSATFGLIFSNGFTILLLALAGAVALMVDRKTRGTGALLLLFFAVSFAATSVGLYFRGHYFIYIMPAAALMCGAAVYVFERADFKAYVKVIARVVLAAALAAPVLMNTWVYFTGSPDDVSKNLHYENPFPEMKTIAAYIKANSSPEDTVAVLGSEPQVYFYSGRYSASGYIYMFPLMEKHDYAGGMQEQAVKQMEKSKPRFIVLVNLPFSWIMNPESDRYIFTWFDKYEKSRYEIAGTADMVTPMHTEYRWGKDVKDKDYKKLHRITVFKRID